jgi:hypothetical protein
MHGNSLKNQNKELAPRDGKIKSQKEKVTTIFSEDKLKLERLSPKKKFYQKTQLKSN